MVSADAGDSFADLTTEYLGRLRREEGTMLAVCTKHCGEMTDSAYSSHKEQKFALDYEKFVQVLPLKVEDTPRAQAGQKMFGSRIHSHCFQAGCCLLGLPREIRERHCH